MSASKELLLTARLGSLSVPCVPISASQAENLRIAYVENRRRTALSR